MDIIGMWKIAEVNVMGQDFKQTWRTVEDVNADASVNPMQKVMAQAVYLFEHSKLGIVLHSLGNGVQTHL